MLYQQQRLEQQLADLRAFRIVEAFGATTGSHVTPGALFPSLAELEQTEADEVDPGEAFRQIRLVLGGPGAG